MFNLKNNGKIKSILFAFLFFLTTFVVGFLGGSVAYKFFDSHESSSLDEKQASNYSSPSLSTIQIVSLAENSVVSIETENETTRSAGSGVVWSEDGYIVTNAHVVDGAKTIKITLHNKQEYTATLIHAEKKHDLALLKINATGLSPVDLGNSDKLKVGERVVVIGNVLGEFKGSATDGIVSATDRILNIDGYDMPLIQTNAEINGGNSGGGMFCEHGQLIGLVVAKQSGENLEGIGFAIPSNTVKEFVNKLI